MFYLYIQVVNLLPEVMFIQVVTGLLDHTLPTIQRKAMELLSNKLNNRKDPIREKEVSNTDEIYYRFVSFPWANNLWFCTLACFKDLKLRC